MLNKRIINTGGEAACTTDTTQILDAGSTQSTALYRFEDNVNDTSNSTGKFSKGAEFNGSNSLVTVSSSLPWSSSFSISMWLKPSSGLSASNYYIPFYQKGYDSSIGGTGLAFYMYGYVLRPWIGSIGGNYYNIFNTGTLTADQWNHVVLTRTYNSQWQLFLNGSSLGTYTAQGLTNDFSDTEYYFGGYFGASYRYNGVIDQARIFNKALSSSEVTTLYNETTSTANTLQVLGDYSCIAAYTFEGNANDLSTNYNGTASNVRYDYSGTASNITYATGKFDKGAVFNGSNSVIDIENMRTVMGNNFAVSLWVKTPSTFASSGYPAILSMYGYTGSGSAYGWDIEYNNSNKITFYWVSSSGVGNYILSSSLSTDTWYHVVAQKDSSSANLYINGQLDNDSTYGSAYGMYYNNFNRMTIGAKRLNYGSTSGHISGMVDQVRLFTKQLSSAEINSLYIETATSAASATIDNPSTVAYYKMADWSDETGSYNATTINNVNFNVEGKYGFAGKFNGTNSYMTTGLTWPGGTQLSWSGWIKTSNTKDTYLFGDFNSSGTNSTHRFSIRIYSQNFGASVNDAAGGLGTTITFGTFAHYGEWAHLVVTVDGTAVKGYVNGSQLGSTGTSSQSLAAGVNAFVLGNYGATTGASQQFDGVIDQVRIFNKTISAAEVTKLYNEIQCANTITAPEDYFNTKLYTGTGASQNITGLNFAPAFVWIKDRSAANWHNVQDTIRGATKHSYTNAQNAEDTTSDGLTSFNSDGFTIGGGGGFGNSGNNFVSWNWKGASSSVTNNVGTITSTVSASPESGFSVVKYTATGTIITNTVGHGLTTKPSLIIQKGINSTSNWFPITDVIDGSVDYLMLNSTNTAADMSGIYANFSINDTTFTNWYSNTSGDIITYCFANVDGYQRIGSYIGNGSNNGPFIYTGFEPAWVIIKNTNTAYRWYMLDNKRCTTNPNNARLFANDSTAETTNSNILNFHTNGFSLITSDAEVNKSGDKILFMAIAANPDTTAPTKANSFKTKIYTGTGSTHAITGLGFKPDFIWTRNRDTTDSSALVDSVRGIVSPAPYLASDANSANATSTNMPTSVQADGYTITGAGGRTNTNGEDYVSWNWKAADHDRNLATINNDGNITSAVSANRAAGFSIITYYPNDTVGMTVGHGLSQAPQIVFSKRLDSAQDWGVYTNVSTGNTTTNWLSLNDGDAYGAGSFMTLNPTTLELPQTGAFWSSASSSQIAYCYHSVTGHSSIGQYTGSGASGKTVTVGFEPSWVLIKNATTTGLSWSIWDNQRSPSNPRNLAAWGDYAGGDYTQTNGLNFNSTSFELLNAANWLNKSGDTFIYMAFK